ncbi:MAG: GNAT family N-acetyltransferase, partial [Betaproteobacteria bacterium]
MSESFSITTMPRAEVDFAIGLAAAEGWNPGLHDADCFHAADPGGFLLGRLDGEPIGCIGAVSYPGGFGFIGLYIIVPAQRGRGFGIQLWDAAMQRLAGGNIGLDGVVAQQANYRRSGFTLAYSNIRYERIGLLSAPSVPELVAAREVPLSTLLDYDRRHFPAPRAAFVQRWIAQPDSAAIAFVTAGEVRGYGV